MKKIKLSLFAAAVLALTACGGGGTTALAPAGNVINGAANLGVVSNGVVTVFKLVNGVKGAQLGSATTGAQGAFTIDVGTYAGPVLLELSNPNGNALYMDEVTGNATALPANPVSSILSSVAANQAVAITPITDIITGAALKQIINGANASTAISGTATLVANAFGLQGMNPITLIPADIANVATATGNAGVYAGVLAALATQSQTVGSTGATGANTGAKLLKQTQAYAAAMFNPATGKIKAPSTLAVADGFAALKTASTNYVKPASFAATPPIVAPTGASYAGNNYYFVYQSYSDADANVDFMQRGNIVLDATARVTPVEAWDRSVAALANNGTVPAVNLSPAFTEALTINQDGTWLMPTSGLGGSISADGLIFAGIAIQNGATANEIVFGVKKLGSTPNAAALAGKVFNFVSDGSALDNAGTVQKYTANGSITFSASGATFTLVQNETIAGVTTTQTTANISYAITTDGLLKVVDPAINMTLYAAFSEAYKYAIWSEANYTAGNGRQFKSVGFAIAQSTATPVLANTAYNYVTSYQANPGIGGGAGKQIERGLMNINAANSGTLPNGWQGQQVTAANTTSACGVVGVAACPGPNPVFTFTTAANGVVNMTAPFAASGFASADGNVGTLEEPGASVIIVIRQ